MPVCFFGLDDELAWGRGLGFIGVGKLSFYSEGSGTRLVNSRDFCRQEPGTNLAKVADPEVLWYNGDDELL